MGDRRGAHRVLVGRPEGKEPLGRPGHRYEDYIKVDLQDVGCAGINFSYRGENRDRWRTLVNVIMKLRVP